MAIRRADRQTKRMHKHFSTLLKSVKRYSRLSKRKDISANNFAEVGRKRHLHFCETKENRNLHFVTFRVEDGVQVFDMENKNEINCLMP